MERLFRRVAAACFLLLVAILSFLFIGPGLVGATALGQAALIITLPALVAVLLCLFASLLAVGLMRLWR